MKIWTIYNRQAVEYDAIKITSSCLDPVVTSLTQGSDEMWITINDEDDMLRIYPQDVYFSYADVIKVFEQELLDEIRTSKVNIAAAQLTLIDLRNTPAKAMEMIGRVKENLHG